MVTFVGGRPVVILTKKDEHPDWMLFILAHELGHLANRHLTEVDGQAIVDEAVNKDDSISDMQEREANGYALQLLTAKQSGIQIGGKGAVSVPCIHCCCRAAANKYFNLDTLSHDSVEYLEKTGVI
jgi:hypothetical protein